VEGSDEGLARMTYDASQNTVKHYYAGKDTPKKKPSKIKQTKTKG